MRVLGIDFTSRPSRRKPITCALGRLDGAELKVASVERWTSFAHFESCLEASGPWIAALDFPFGQSARFIRNIGWPQAWADYVGFVATLSREEFRQKMDDYRQPRAIGDKEHKRSTDRVSGSSSPQKIYGVPVGLMFFEGAPRLLASGVTVAGVHPGDPQRIVVEAYPGALARALIGRRSYKNDTRSKQTDSQLEARLELLNALRSPRLTRTHGIRLKIGDEVAKDPAADDLDAVLCAVQAAAAWLRRDSGFGAPADLDPNEGWIAEPTLYL